MGGGGGYFLFRFLFLSAFVLGFEGLLRYQNTGTQLVIEVHVYPF